MSGEKVYLDYDRAGLDAQYRLREAVAEAEALVARGREWSQRTRATRTCTLDIAFGPTSGQKLDYFPGAPGAPVYVFVHGGYWQRMDKADFDYIADGIVPSGAHFVSVNYDLAPVVKVDEIVQQVRSAIAWVWRHAADHGGDPEQIHVLGHSAGGHLTAMMALTDWAGTEPDLPQHLVKSACAVSGLYDLEPLRLCYLNDVLGMDAAAAERESPIHLVPDRHISPLTLAVGGNETDEFHRQQKAFADALEAAGHAPRILDMPGHDHFTVVLELGDPQSALVRGLLAET